MINWRPNSQTFNVHKSLMLENRRGTRKEMVGNDKLFKDSFLNIPASSPLASGTGWVATRKN